MISRPTMVASSHHGSAARYTESGRGLSVFYILQKTQPLICTRSNIAWLYRTREKLSVQFAKIESEIAQSVDEVFSVLGGSFNPDVNTPVVRGMSVICDSVSANDRYLTSCLFSDFKSSLNSVGSGIVVIVELSHFLERRQSLLW